MKLTRKVIAVGNSNSLTITLTRELKEMGIKAHDYVYTEVKDGKLVIEKVI